MAIIKDINEIKELIPTFKDLARCGNFASVESNITKSKPLYAFSINGMDGITTKHYKVRFVFIALNLVYVLVLVGEDGKVGRYCDFVAVPRDVSKPINPHNWGWNEDDIGLFLKSDNISSNIIYFGTDEQDADEIRKGILEGKRKLIPIKRLDQDVRNLVLETLKYGMPSYATNKTKGNPLEKRDTTTKCLPSPDNVTGGRQFKSSIDYMSVLNRYLDIKEKKEEAIASKKKEKETVITETVIV
jgi:hypothetical protein